MIQINLLTTPSTRPPLQTPPPLTNTDFPSSTDHFFKKEPLVLNLDTQKTNPPLLFSQTDFERFITEIKTALSEERSPEELDTLLAAFSQRPFYHFPENAGGGSRTHMVGNSLGPLYIPAMQKVLHELQRHALQADDGHYPWKNKPDQDWLSISEWEPYLSYLADLLGCQTSDCVLMGQLTINTNTLLQAFMSHVYGRNGPKKILILEDEFPSDRDAVISQIKLYCQSVNGFLKAARQNNSQLESSGLLNPEDLLIKVPVNEMGLITDQEVLDAIDKNSGDLGMVWMSALDFQRGYFYDLEKITAMAHQHNILVGFNLAHALGNIPLSLSEWQVDFASFCGYKYLNAGPGAMGGIYVRERYHGILKASGWFGRTLASRFSNMAGERQETTGISSWIQSNPNVLGMTAVYENLVPFHRMGIKNLREISILLTAYLEKKLIQNLQKYIRILNPDPQKRGAQLSVRFLSTQFNRKKLAQLLKKPIQEVDDKSIGHYLEEALRERGIAVDVRGDLLLRITPSPLYNNFSDVDLTVKALAEVLQEIVI